MTELVLLALWLVTQRRAGPGGKWAGLRPELARKLQRVFRRAKAAGLRPRLSRGRVSTEEQARVYAAYLAGGPFAAAPGTSKHERGEAADVLLVDAAGAVLPDADLAWRELGLYGEDEGLRWGGRWGDPGDVEYDAGHLELP